MNQYTCFYCFILHQNMSTSDVHIVKYLLAICINDYYSINPLSMDNQSGLIWRGCLLTRLGMCTWTNQLSFKQESYGKHTKLAMLIVPNFSVERVGIKKLLLWWNIKIQTFFLFPTTSGRYIYATFLIDILQLILALWNIFI